MKETLVKVKARAKETLASKQAKITMLSTSAMLLMPTIAMAADEGLPDTVLASINQGFTQMAAIATQVIGLSVVATVSVVCISSGAKYAIKQIKGALASAA